MTLHKIPWLLTALWAAGALLPACGEASPQPPVSESLTRGIGVYPGLPGEHFGPTMVAGGKQERNLALHRAATASSSYDYNLTAQLLTDGMLSKEMPNLLRVRLQEEEVVRDNKEKLFDSNMLTGLAFTGGTGALELSFEGPDPLPAATRMVLQGSLEGQEPGAGRYSLQLYGANEGTDWTLLATSEGKGLPGKIERDFYGRIGRYFAVEAPLPEGYTRYKAQLQADGARAWFLHTWDFFEGARLLDMIPSYRFRSAWMAATGGEEWVQVDLGASAQISGLTLHWLNPAARGRVEISANGQDWKPLCSLDPAPEDGAQALACQGKGQFLRLHLEASANGEPYVLSELEVRGQGGLVARAQEAPAPQEGEWLLSGGNWKLQRASALPALDGEPGVALSRPDFDDSAWIPATVPATVLSSYYHIGALPDPNYGNNQLHLSESFFNSDFWYRNTFALPQDFAGKELFLHFDGINWKARVFLNGEDLGRIEGAFTSARFDVTRCARPGENVLAVQIIKNDHPGIIKEKNRISADINGGILGADNPTFHASIGWDWIPTIRGRNLGIWNDVRLTAHAGGVTLSDPFVTTSLPLPDTSYAHILASVTVENHRAVPVEGTLVFTYGPLEARQAVQLGGNECRQLAFEPQRLDRPQLWWPKGYGPAHLYEASLRFETGGVVSDACRFLSGVRQMAYSLEGGIFDMYINGRRLIGNGGNWGFPESNLNFRGREYDIAVAYHADMNFTMIRNWVGMTGDDEFYQACDRHGVMVWQDFWLANPWDGPDPENNALFLANAQNYVKRIRNHPSIALYVGRNEGDPPQELNEGLDQLVARLHPGHFYLPNSADGPVSGRGPYRALPVKEYFELEPGKDKFHSERGMPNVMTYESLVQMLPTAHQWPQTPLWGLHDFTLENAQQCETFNVLIEKFFGQPQNLKEFASWAQWLNYDGYRAMYESRSWNRKGLLIWMSHSCWPSQVWQTYDYYFEPTAAYFACKKASAPLRIQWNPVLEKVEVVNNNAPSYPELWVRARVINCDGTPVFEAKERIESLTDSTVPVCGLDLDPERLAPVYFIKLELFEGTRLVADNFYWQGKEENNLRALRQLPRVKLSQSHEVVQEGEGYKVVSVLRNSSDTPALMVRLRLQASRDGDRILPAFYQDNYFSLLPGEEKTVVTTCLARDSRGQVPVMAVEGFNVE